ncbi:WD domain containing protein 14 [Sarcoptes scabiei]|uniref:WD domain containing protein 14 n=1 Tax=Sarcoptes scabiei TaxID=52283 RepID=A0A131ZTI8_SARSC|nr:WD domain containing protein 14 [Sarcoptes scabiei]
MDEFIALSTDESFLSNNSSLGGSDQNLHSVFVRFAELEKKITEQNDEIVCLKSTLADVLRRLNQLEGRAIVTTSYHNHNQSLSSQNSNGISKNVPNNRSNSLLKTYGRNLTTLTHHYNGSWNQQFNTGTLSPQSANNRRYQSSTSLQTDQLNGSASCSPSSSPQPSSSSSIWKTYTLNNVTGPPLQRLKLEWVYGYRGKDCRHNLYLLPTGEIVYFLASVVVLYNIDDQIQRHYTGHTSEVRCITIHPNKLLIATGQNNNHDW